jgi:hypothetical protein
VPCIHLVGSSPRGFEAETFWPLCLGVVPRTPQVGIYEVSPPQAGASEVSPFKVGTLQIGKVQTTSFEIGVAEVRPPDADVRTSRFEGS